MASGAIAYTAGDELPVWEETVTFDGTAPDLSSGWTFQVTLTRDGQDPIVKNAGILGETAGRVQVQWDDGELDIAPGTWRGQLRCRRDSDSADFTVRRPIFIRAAA